MGGGGQGDDDLAAYKAGLDHLIQRLARRGGDPAPAQHEREEPMTRRKAAPKLADKIVLEGCTSIEGMRREFERLAPGGTLVVTFPRDWFLEHDAEIGGALPAPMTPLNIGTYPGLTDRSGAGIICSRSRS